MRDYWQRQNEAAIFPDLLWSRPENRQFAGRLLIVGGTGQGFADIAEVFQHSEKAGVGTARIIMPDALRRTVGKLIPEAQFAPCTPSGSLALSALGEILEVAEWAEGVCVSSDSGNNSETTRLFETLLSKSQKPVTLCGDVIDMFLANPLLLLDRPNTTLVLRFDQLQKLAIAAHHTEAFTSDMALVQFIERLQSFAENHSAFLIVSFGNSVAVSAEGQISTTTRADHPSHNAVAAACATWWLQNPTKPYAALTTSLFRPL